MRGEPQHQLNAETVAKKLAVLVTLEHTGNMKATIEQRYKNFSPVAYSSKYAQIYGWKQTHKKLRNAVRDHKEHLLKLQAKGVTTLTHEQELRKEGFPNLHVLDVVLERRLGPAKGAFRNPMTHITTITKSIQA